MRNWTERDRASFFNGNDVAGIGDAGAGGWAGINMTGGLGLNQKQFYKTQAWRRARKAYVDSRVKIDGGVCEACHEELGTIVHHYKTWLDDINCNDPDISLNPDNFKLECQTCHNKEVDPRKGTPGRCTYGPNGEVIRNTEW